MTRHRWIVIFLLAAPACAKPGHAPFRTPPEEVAPVAYGQLPSGATRTVVPPRDTAFPTTTSAMYYWHGAPYRLAFNQNLWDMLWKSTLAEGPAPKIDFTRYNMLLVRAPKGSPETPPWAFHTPDGTGVVLKRESLAETGDGNSEYRVYRIPTKAGPVRFVQIATQESQKPSPNARRAPAR